MKIILIPAEVYSRVSGYFRPVVQWNQGKQEEFAERKSLQFENTIITEIQIKNQ